MSLADWMTLAGLHLSLSLLAVGGAVTLAPALHLHLVRELAWLSPAQFTQALVLAQAAPGPNVLFIALLGWQVGVGGSGAAPASAAALVSGLCGALLSLAAVLLPSSLLALGVTRWIGRHQQHLAVQAFRLGLAPVVIGVLMSTATLLLQGERGGWPEARPLLLAAGVALLVWRTRLALPWMLAAGALLGACGQL